VGGTTTIGENGFTINQGSSTSRVTGFTFISGNSNAVVTSGSPTSAAFRIDHNNFGPGSIFILTNGNAPGLIDHNTFLATQSAEMIHNLGLGPSNAAGWTGDVTPGGPLMLFIEDNTFTFGGTSFFGTSAVQSYYGARTVFRHNSLTMSQVDQHGTAGMIGARWWEIYENTFNIIPNGNQSQYMQIRAGSGVIFNNHTTGSLNLGAGQIELLEEDSGYPALYQIGRGINEAYSPAYIWGNDATMNVASGSSNVQAGRDYFVSATQPSTLLRQELASDTSSSTHQYQPYTYPHPLQNGTSSAGPNPPTGLVAVVQ